MMKFIPKVLDRAGFWPRAVLLVIVHLGLAFATIAGAKLGGLDTLVVIALALVVGARFRDIGWPAWTAISFMLLTMGLGPIGVTAYAIANNLPMDGFMAAMNTYGWFSGPLNLALLVLAGSMPGGKGPQLDQADDGLAPNVFPAAGDTQAGADLALRQGEQGVPSLVAPERSANQDVLLAIGAVFVVAVLIGGVVLIHGSLSGGSSQLASQPAPQVRIAGPQTERNGLTKDTNDYLRQLQSASRPQSAPNVQSVFPAPPRTAP